MGMVATRSWLLSLGTNGDGWMFRWVEIVERRMHATLVGGISSVAMDRRRDAAFIHQPE